ncbi:hypothetical protein ACNOYE_33250 [Nannocystaceae bacterium ST9]
MQSIELRWFAEWAPSDRELRDFDERGEFEIRTDDYLWGTGDALGIKLRGGRLETKRRERIDALTLEVGELVVRGSLERWTKLSEPPRTARAGERWIAVAKRRALLSLVEGRSELTRLELLEVGELVRRGPVVQCSLAVELLASPDEGLADIHERMRVALADLLDRHASLLPLTRAWSGGYPAWLTRSLELRG